MSRTIAHPPLLLELDDETRAEHLDRAAHWFRNVQMVQATFRQLAEDTLGKVHEPHVREYLAHIVEKAREHEARVDALFRAIGREPSSVRETMGELGAKGRAAMADLMGMAGGAAGTWRDLHQLFLASLNAVSAFGAAEQLGLALGNPEVVEVALQVTAEKFAHHRQLEELVLDFVPVAILYRMDI